MPVLVNEIAVEEMIIIKEKFESNSIELEPCMDWRDLDFFEYENKIIFPGDYRLYLLNIGNGVRGGPCQEGILKFGETSLRYPLNSADLLTALGKSFPYEEEHIVVNREGVNIQQGSAKDTGGYIVLGSCVDSFDHFWILIFEENSRGEVWIGTRHGSFYPCSPRMSFKVWLLDWLYNDGRKLEQSLTNTQDEQI